MGLPRAAAWPSTAACWSRMLRGEVAPAAGEVADPVKPPTSLLLPCKGRATANRPRLSRPARVGARAAHSAQGRSAQGPHQGVGHGGEAAGLAHVLARDDWRDVVVAVHGADGPHGAALLWQEAVDHERRGRGRGGQRLRLRGTGLLGQGGRHPAARLVEELGGERVRVVGRLGRRRAAGAGRAAAALACADVRADHKRLDRQLGAPAHCTLHVPKSHRAGFAALLVLLPCRALLAARRPPPHLMSRDLPGSFSL